MRFGPREHASGKKQRRALLTCWDVREVLEFLDVESLYRHGLALVPGPVDDGATPPLAQDAALVLTVLQLAVLQEEPARNTVHAGVSSEPQSGGGGSRAGARVDVVGRLRPLWRVTDQSHLWGQTGLQRVIRAKPIGTSNMAFQIPHLRPRVNGATQHNNVQ